MAAQHAVRKDLGAIRLAMGEKMVLGLEFFLAGDIVQTIVVPTWNSLAILGGIVVIRTVIVYFMNLELSRGASRHGRRMMTTRHRVILQLSATASAERAADIVRRVFRDYPGNMAVRLWNGQTLAFGGGAPEFTLVFREPRPLRELILTRDPLRLAEAYLLGKVDVEGNLYAALQLKDYLQSLRLSVAEKAAFLSAALCWGALWMKTQAGLRQPGAHPCSTRLAGKHSRTRDRQAIAFHYDVSNDFYRLLAR